MCNDYATYALNNIPHATLAYTLLHKLQKRDDIFVNLYKIYCIGAHIEFRNIQNRKLQTKPALTYRFLTLLEKINWY